MRSEELFWSGRLVEIEQAIRQFEDRDRPAYERWLRLEFGPLLSATEEIYEKIRERRLFVGRLQELMDRDSLSPREALFALQNGQRESGADFAEEVEARRRAKLEAKREARRQAKREAKREAKLESRREAVSPERRSVLVVFRSLARKLHPDSPHFEKDLPPERVRQLWGEVHEAYRAGNLESLLAIEAWLEQSSEVAAPVTPRSASLSERFERLRALKRSAARLEKELARMGEHSAWDFASLRGPLKKKARAQAAHRIEEELARAQEALNALEDFVEELGPPQAPRKNRRR